MDILKLTNSSSAKIFLNLSKASTFPSAAACKSPDAIAASIKLLLISAPAWANSSSIPKAVDNGFFKPFIAFI